ncbi:ankyrin repeat domain-containing protein [Solirubrobacter soli]|uniref:ankyrin repeat domain-containing protein n=1 Tax=Solirubrobacter soli TaxID=363832 RepID=UPI000400EBBB|nr:ankyrin repeat domain-containing protein [Solirubrobacter soli]
MPRLPHNPTLEGMDGYVQRLLAGGEEAGEWVRAYHPSPPASLGVEDARLVVARAVGFEGWVALVAYLDVVARFNRSPHAVGECADPADEFLRLACLTYSGDDPARWEAATRMLAAAPEIARSSLHAAAGAGDADAVRSFLAAASRRDPAPPAPVDAASPAPGDAAAPPAPGDAAPPAPGDAAAPPAPGDAAAPPAPSDAAPSAPGDAAPSAPGDAAPSAPGDAAASAPGDAAPSAPGDAAAPPAVNALGGPHRWEPLLYVLYSRVPGGDALAVARLLLEAGADPNAGYLWEGLSPPFTALTGAFGSGEGDPPPHRDSLALARLLLEAGADPNDAQAVYNLHWHADDGWLELLLEFGFGGGDGGVWHARLAGNHPTPRENAEDCLMWAAVEGFAHRVELLTRAGVDPDGRGTAHPILEGRGALELALAHGHTDVVRALRAAGATEPELTEAERVEAAYMAADVSVTAPPPPGLIARAAASSKADAVALLLERGADVNAMPGRATALHEAAFRGDRAIVDLLLAAGADRTIRDREFNADAAGWASHAGHTSLATHLS